VFDLLANRASSNELANISRHSRPKESSSNSPISSFEPGMCGASGGPVDFFHDLESHGSRNT